MVGPALWDSTFPSPHASKLALVTQASAIALSRVQPSSVLRSPTRGYTCPQVS